MKIGVLGGTFNPIHYGHLRAAEDAREMLSLDRILFVPSANPPLKKEGVADASHRYDMVKLSIAGNRFFEALDIEYTSPGKSYTVITLEKLSKLYAGAELFFIVGIDAFLDIPNWWKPEELLSVVNFVVLSRPGRKFMELRSSPYLEEQKTFLDKLDSGKLKEHTVKLRTGKTASLLSVTPFFISSTDIRERRNKGMSVKYLLPEAVESFIISNRIYVSDK